MEQWEHTLRALLEKMGFGEVGIEVMPEGRRVSLFVRDEYVPLKKALMQFVDSFQYVAQLIAKKNGWETVFVDINNFRKERERIIIDLARAAAKKAQATKQNVSLPAMNAYERRIIHVELAMRPDVKTESEGQGKGRFVVIQPIE